jgi:hypothetical protein
MGNGQLRRIFRDQLEQLVRRDRMEVMERMEQMGKQFQMHLQLQVQ